MIYTVTFNPSLDYIVDVEDFRLGMTNRTTSEQMMAGGKGINVSIVLQNLGIASTALGFIAGFTGEEIRRQVSQLGIHAQFISVPQGISRINLKLRSIDGTEINGMGPTIGKPQLDALYEKLDALTDKDTLVLAGSIPASMPASIYSDILARLCERGVTFVVDATKQLLLNVLCYRPSSLSPTITSLASFLASLCPPGSPWFPTQESFRSGAPGMYWYPWQVREPFWLPRMEASISPPPQKGHWLTR